MVLHPCLRLVERVVHRAAGLSAVVLVDLERLVVLRPCPGRAERVRHAVDRRQRCGCDVGRDPCASTLDLRAA